VVGLDLKSSVLIRDKNLLNVTYKVPYGEGYLEKVSETYIQAFL